MKSLFAAILFTLTLTVSASAEASTCSVDVKNGRGNTQDVFTSYGYDRQDACQQAKRDCKRAIRNRYYQGRNHYCEVQGRHGGNGGYGQQVTKQCSSSMVGPRGRTIQTFRATAHGQRVQRGPRSQGGGQHVKRKACQKALRKCNRAKSEQGRFRAQCVSNRGQTQRRY